MRFISQAQNAALVTFGGVIFFGANNPLFCAALAALLGVLLIFDNHPTISLPRWLLTLWSLIMLWAVIQILPLPAFLSLLVHPLQTVTPTISLAPQNGILAILNGCLYAAAFALAWRVGSDEIEAQNLLQNLGIVVLFVALYGLLMYTSNTPIILWQPKLFYQADLTATFINRNTYATFSGLGTLTALATALYRVGEIPSRLSWPQRAKAFWVLVAKPGRWWFVTALIIFITLLLSHSRAGLVATLLGLAAFWLALVCVARPARVFLLMALPFVLLLGCFLMFTAGQTTLNRLDQTTTDTQTRTTIQHISWQAAQAQPMLGNGLGSFESAFRLYRTPDLTLANTARIDHAHNSWLEFLLEMGWATTLLAITLFGGLVFTFIRGLIVRHNGIIYPALGLSSLFLVAAHAWVDFSLNIPGFSIFFSMLMGLCAVQSLPRNVRQNLIPTKWQYSGILLALAGAYLMYPTANAWRAEHTIATWQRAGATPIIKLLTARHQLTLAIHWWPYARWQRQLGLLDLILAQNSNPTGALILNAAAQKNLQAAVNVQPADPYSWHYLTLLEINPEIAATDLYNSIISSPAEPNLLQARAPLIQKYRAQLLQRDPTLLEEQLRLTATPRSAY